MNACYTVVLKAKFDGGFAGVAQLAEHQPSKLRVAGSSPVSRFYWSFYELTLIGNDTGCESAPR